MRRQKLVVVGNGMAGIRTVEELLKLVPDKYDISVFGSEPYGNYNRILLSPVLTGEKTIKDIMLNDLDWYEQHGITLFTGKIVEQVNRRYRQVIASGGIMVEYDKLLLATGSNPLIIPIPGRDLKNVITFRDIQDVNKLLALSQQHKTAVVIGGGLLGLEAANGLLKQGMDVTVVHDQEFLMNRQLDRPAAKLLQQTLEQKGMKFRTATLTSQIAADAEGKVCKVLFKDGSETPAELVVMAVGIRPNIELAKTIALQCDRGILVNDTMQTYDPRIYAVGECVQHRGQIFGLVAPLFEQAKVCANHLAEYGIAHYSGSVTSTKLKVTGVELFSAGDFVGDKDSEDIVFQDPNRGVYKKVTLKNNKIIGSVLYGDTMDGSWYFQLMKDETNVTDFRDALLFGQAHVGDSGHAQTNSVATLPDSAQICGCNGVCKGTIVNTILDKKLFTLEEVRAATKASASCGSCTGMVEQLLVATVGGNHSPSKREKPLCPCTDYTHEVIRDVIIKQQLKTMTAIRKELEWRNADGCHICRPALNFYLLATWPGEYQDDAQSRFINERAHANIQKDNTYSVVPRIWGGVVTSDELRAIANAADKYQVPMIKITGGQRIDLLGIRKTELPAVWEDLNKAGMVSGHAYGKALRTVKTCVGSEFCRFGTQNSTDMGIKMEKMTWGSWTPAKVKMAVSGCPRNCAEATIKDFGVVAVDSGWELYVAGNGGMKVRVAEFLTKVTTEDEVLEYTGAFMQLYREEGRHNERTAPWIERVGLSYIKTQLVENADNRSALYQRFLLSQQYAQVDPWAERASGKVSKQDFIPVAEIV